MMLVKFGSQVTIFIVEGIQLRELLEAEKKIYDVNVGAFPGHEDPVVGKNFDRDKLGDEELHRFHKQGDKMEFLGSFTEPEF